MPQHQRGFLVARVEWSGDQRAAGLRVDIQCQPEDNISSSSVDVYNIDDDHRDDHGALDADNGMGGPRCSTRANVLMCACALVLQARSESENKKTVKMKQ